MEEKKEEKEVMYPQREVRRSAEAQVLLRALRRVLRRALRRALSAYVIAELSVRARAQALR